MSRTTTFCTTTSKSRRALMTCAITWRSTVKITPMLIPNNSLSTQRSTASQKNTAGGRSACRSRICNSSFFCVIHLDTNPCAAWPELYEAHALQLAGARSLSYDGPKSPHRRFHGAMDTADMGPLADRHRNRLPPYFLGPYGSLI